MLLHSMLSLSFKRRIPTFGASYLPGVFHSILSIDIRVTHFVYCSNRERSTPEEKYLSYHILYMNLPDNISSSPVVKYKLYEFL